MTEKEQDRRLAELESEQREHRRCMKQLITDVTVVREKVEAIFRFGWLLVTAVIMSSIAAVVAAIVAAVANH